MRSIEASLQRLAMDRVDIALLHGPQDYYEAAIGEAYPALADLRSQGVVTAIGAGMNDWETPTRFAREGDFDCFLIAGRYTLLDQTALAELLPLCQEKGISVILGGPYNSGILASDLSPDATYQYAKAPADVLDRARRIGSVCNRYGVPLNAAALQFGLAHPGGRLDDTRSAKFLRGRGQRASGVPPGTQCSMGRPEAPRTPGSKCPRPDWHVVTIDAVH